ncbi:MAG: FkbM family methyltransferase [Devosia sp.]
MPDYEQMLEDFYTNLLRSGDVCVDVGAHVGRHTFPLARCVGARGRIFAFEPIPAIAQQLRAKIEATPGLSSSVELQQCALADTVGETDFVLVHEAPGYSGLRPRHYDAPVTTEIIRVAVRRLDDLATEMPPVRFIKIDCEGAELSVLRGATSLLMRDRPIVSFECGNASLESYDYDAGDIFDFWDAQGYEIQSIEDKRLNRIEFVAASAKQDYWDYIASPRDI